MKPAKSPGWAKVKRTEALIRLNKERAYEDELVAILTDFLDSRIPHVPGLTEEEKKRVHEDLLIIKQDSITHSFIFNEMVQLVFESGEQDTF